MALMGVATGAALTPMMGLLSSWFRVQDRGLAAGLAATGGSVAFIFAGIAVHRRPITSRSGFQRQPLR